MIPRTWLCRFRSKCRRSSRTSAAEQDIVQFGQRILYGERLHCEDIQTRSRKPLILESGGEAVLVDQLTAGDIDQVGGRLHQRQFRRTDQTASLRVRRQCRLKKSASLSTSGNVVSRMFQASASTGRHEANRQ